MTDSFAAGLAEAHISGRPSRTVSHWLLSGTCPKLYARTTGDSLATKVKIAHEKLAIYEYRQQKEALDEAYEKDGPDVFVPS